MFFNAAEPQLIGSQARHRRLAAPLHARRRDSGVVHGIFPRAHLPAHHERVRDDAPASPPHGQHRLDRGIRPGGQRGVPVHHRRARVKVGRAGPPATVSLRGRATAPVLMALQGAPSCCGDAGAVRLGAHGRRAAAQEDVVKRGEGKLCNTLRAADGNPVSHGNEPQ